MADAVTDILVHGVLVQNDFIGWRAHQNKLSHGTA